MLMPPPTHPLQTYTAPQATGQYRFIMGGSVALNDGGWFEDDAIGGARVTPAFVSPSLALLPVLWASVMIRCSQGA